MTLITDIIKQIIRVLRLDQINEMIRTEVRRHYDKGMENVEVQLQMNFDRDPGKIEYLEEYEFDNIKGMTEDVSERLRKELNEGVQNLESVRQLKKRVEGVMDVSESRALMIARTEANRAENFGKLDAAREAERQGLSMKKYLSVHEDTRTSPICQAMDRKYGTKAKAIPIDGIFTVSREIHCANG